MLRDNILIEDEIDQVRVLPERRRAALELQAEIDALGVDNVALIRMIRALIRMIREMSSMQVPEYIGGDISSYAEALPMPVLRDLMSRLRPPAVGEPQAAWPVVSFTSKLCETC